MSAVKKNQSLVQELFKVGLYKKNQGRLTRQLTALGLLLVVGYGLWTLAKGPLAAVDGAGAGLKVGLPMALLAGAAWIIYRAVNFPKFADFLISVEAEMDKVTWASRSELYRATIVVIVVMVFMAALLFAYDQLWLWFFRLIGFVVKPEAGAEL
jgi:preprotein translocase subunit SecE